MVALYLCQYLIKNLPEAPLVSMFQVNNNKRTLNDKEMKTRKD